MKQLLYRWANKAHRHPSPWVRRPVIVVSMLFLVVYMVVFWALIPLWLVLIFSLEVGLTAFKEICGMPAVVIATARDEAEQWRRNWPGAVRIWRAQKVEPPLERSSTQPRHG